MRCFHVFIQIKHRELGNVISMGVVNFLRSKKFLGFGALFTTFLFLLVSEPKPQRIIEIRSSENLLIFREKALDDSDIEEWVNLRKNSGISFSKLSEILFLNASEPNEAEKHIPINGRYSILVWKYGKTIENRHLKHFSGTTIDPFEYCPVKNCNITYNDEAIDTADIVIFHLHRMKGREDVPVRKNEDQIWAFLTDESPYNTFLDKKVYKLSDYNGLFNWSMTYRMDADIPVPYGRTVLKTNAKPTTEIRMEKRRDVLVAIMGSNCGGINHRWQYVQELQKHIQVDVYGGCGPFKNCPGHFKADCPALDRYLFYLSFENSNCNEYITEKVWWNAIRKNSIPIVMGASRDVYQRVLPPESYINVDDFASPSALAQYLLRLNQTQDFKKYFRWKANFEVLNEHGYFQSKSYHYCRICQALNYNSREPQVYNNLEKYWSVDQDCHPAWDTWED